MAPPERKRRGRLIAAGVAIALLLLAGGAAAFVVLNQPQDVSNPDVEFRAEAPVATPEEELEPEPAPEAGKKQTPRIDRFIWAHYGYTRDRRRYLPVKDPPRPPFRELWQYQGHVLLEFPPVIGGKRLYLLNDSGRLLAIHKNTGRVKWAKRLGALAAASPAYADGVVYVVLLQRAKRGPGAGRGRVVALDGETGRVRWSRELASRSESSPLVQGDRLYFGSESGTVYAMNTRNGDVQWRFQADGAVKGGLALADGRLFFGDYGGRAYAIRASDGGQVWKTGTSGGRLGLSGGNFYSTPAVAYGRVYMGNTDGRMYSFSAGDGQIAWSRSTGGYVYASPAVAAVPGYPPTVYFGSYSGRFYALDARSGDVRWSRGGYGRISGGATVIGDIVYFADLGNKKSHGLGARTGRPVFTFERGSYNPVVSDGRTIFLAGYHALYALQPLTVQQKQAREKARERKAKLARTDKRFCRARARDAHRGQPRAQRRSTRRCVARKAERRQSGKRAECRKRARELHGKREKKVARSYRRCVDRRNIGGR